MKLLEIHAENFGVFRNRRFDFGGEGFCLVHGPNEAGKSTLLQLVRESLFGFPHSSTYAVDSGPMQADVAALLRDGSRLLFRRRKGRKEVVDGRLEPSGAQVDEARLAHLLGHATASFYQNVFAFSLTELGRGASSFQQAGLTLTEALFGGSVGGITHLPRVKRQLREDYEALFKPAAKKLPINELLTKLKDDRKRLKEVAVKPAHYKELEARLADTKSEIETAQQQHGEQSARRAHLQRLDNAWEHYRALAEARRELQTLEVPETLRPGDAQRCESLEAALADLAAQLQQTRDALAAQEREHLSLARQPELLQQAAAIKSLEHEIGKIEGFLRDLPEREKELATAESRVAATLKALDPDWTIEDLARLKLSLDHRTRIQELIDRSRANAEARKSMDKQRLELGPAIERKRKRLATASDDDGLEALTIALAEETRFSTERDKVRRALKREAQLHEELAQLEARLAASVASLPQDMAAIRPPMSAAIEEFRERFARLDNQAAMLQDRRATAEGEWQEVQRGIAGMEAAGVLADRRLLEEARTRRDDGWRLVRRHYIEGQACDEPIAKWLADPLASLPEEYARAVTYADQLADDRQRQADAVAQKELLLSRRQQLEGRLDQFQAELAELTQQRQSLSEQWRALWQPCGIVPESPGVMLEWLGVLAAWQQRAAERCESEATRAEAQHFCDDFEPQLRAACGNAVEPSESIDRVLHKARMRKEDARQARGRIEELIALIDDDELQLEQLAQERERLDEAERAWRAEWHALLVQCDLPQDWKVDAIERLLHSVEQAVADDRIARDLRQRVSDMRTERDAFDKQSKSLAKSVAPDLAALPMIERVQQLAARSHEAQAAHTRSVALADEIDRLRHEAQTRQERLSTTRAQRDELWQQVGAKDSADFRRLTKDAVRRDQLLEEIRSAERALSVAREHEPEAEFLAALSTLDRDRLRSERAALDEQLQRLASRMNELREQSGKRQQELDQLHQEGDALCVQQAIESHRGQLREQIERYTSLVLAEKVLESALEQFQREHQDDVLAEARRLFCQLTGGKHVDIRLGVSESFTVVDALGEHRRPDDLSRGTQEQLYLAFRLAYVKHYCRDREPLPFVMDDVLVNFDPERASATIEALLDLSQQVQIIFLTCHPTTVELVRQQAPECTLVELAGDREVAEV